MSVVYENFYGQYFGHEVRDLETIVNILGASKNKLFLAGDSSFDNKYWFGGSVAAVNGYETCLAPPKAKQDIAYWLNFEMEQRQLNLFALNCAVEESSIGSRIHKLPVQDQFLRDTISKNDILVVSLGGNDVVLKPTLCGVLSTLSLV